MLPTSQHSVSTRGVSAILDPEGEAVPYRFHHPQENVTHKAILTRTGTAEENEAVKIIQ